jgi:transcriptional regulator with XRE-family HTH domain
MAEAIDPHRPDDSDAELGRLLRVQRMARGMSQTELGNAIGVTFQQIQNYEIGANRISMGRLARIAGVLGVSVTYLLGGSRRPAWPRSSNKEHAKFAEAARLLGRVGATRLLRAFHAVPAKPAKLREIIVELVAAVAEETDTARRSARRRRSGSRITKRDKD